MKKFDRFAKNASRATSKKNRGAENRKRKSKRDAEYRNEYGTSK